MNKNNKLQDFLRFFEPRTVAVIGASTRNMHALPNVFITPHLAGSLGTELRRMTDHAIDEIDQLPGVRSHGVRLRVLDL